MSAAGIDIAEASMLVKSMPGDYRLPQAVKQVDRLARGYDDWQQL